MQSNQEPNCIFGGMAIPQWEFNGEWRSDPIDKCS